MIFVYDVIRQSPLPCIIPPRERELGPEEEEEGEEWEDEEDVSLGISSRAPL